MIVSLDWGSICKQFAEKYHWLPGDVADRLTVGALVAVWGVGAAGRSREALRPYNAEEVREHVNRRRAEKGKPPLTPRRKR